MKKVSRDEFLDLLPAFAIGALDDDEQQQIIAYLREHSEDEHEVTAMRDEINLLALTAPPIAPPPAARAALLARVNRLATSTAGGQEVSENPARTARAGRLLRYALAAVAAALILALLGWNIALQRQLTAQNEAQQIGKLVSNPEAAHPLSSGGNVIGTFNLPPAGYIYSVPGDRLAVMHCYWLPQLQPGQTYQLWLVTPTGQRDNGGVFTVDSRGDATVIVHAPEAFAKYAEIGVTIEPESGSPAPTSPRIIGAKLR